MGVLRWETVTIPIVSIDMYMIHTKLDVYPDRGVGRVQEKAQSRSIVLQHYRMHCAVCILPHYQSTYYITSIFCMNTFHRDESFQVFFNVVKTCT